MEIEATGPFRPGTPIVIRARARANRTASATDIQLISLDDDASAIRGAETRGRVLERVAGAIAKGSERTITSSITFEREGYYRVRARAVGEPGAAELAKAPSDSVVLNLSTETLWIVVDEAGGRLTTGFDSTVATTPHQRLLFGSYGPFQAIAATGEQGAGSLSASGAVELSTTSGGYHYDGQVRYNDADVNAYRSVPDALINAVCHASGSPDVAVSTRTSQSGGFAFDCPAGYTTVTGNIYLSNAYADVRGPEVCALVCVYGIAGGSFSGSFGQYLLLSVANDFAARAYKTLTTYVPRTFSKFGRTRGPVLVAVSEVDDGETGLYTNSRDRILLSRTTLVGPYGRFSTMHEYGHAFQWVAIDHWYSYSCNPLPHHLDSLDTGSCAYVEGFADFLSVWIAGDSLSGSAGGFYTDDKIEANPFYQESDGDPDGAYIEGAVAAFLYDLVDGPNDPDGFANETGSDDDTSTTSAANVAYVMRYCTLGTLFGSRDKLDGIDQFVYCAEASLAAQSAYPQYFHYRSETFTTVNVVRPSSWSQSVIRELWLRNLYDTSTPLPPPSDSTICPPDCGDPPPCEPGPLPCPEIATPMIAKTGTDTFHTRPSLPWVLAP